MECFAKEIIKKLVDKEIVSKGEITRAYREIKEDKWTEAQKASFLTALKMRYIEENLPSVLDAMSKKEQPDGD